MHPSLIGFTPLRFRTGFMENVDDPGGQTTAAVASRTSSKTRIPSFVRGKLPALIRTSS
jgi:hypothetical protein